MLIDLKVQPFKPEFAGKMNFYLSAADDLLRHPDDKPSIGLILCREKNRITAEYALRDVRKPIGVAGWQTMFTESLPSELAADLPTVERIEQELAAGSPTIKDCLIVPDRARTKSPKRDRKLKSQANKQI